VRLRGHDVADGAGVDAPDHLLVGRGIAALESHRHADLARALAADLLDALRSVDVGGHRLLEVGVLVRGHRRLEVIRMEVGRARDEHRVHGRRGEELLVGLGALEEHGRVDLRLALLLGQLVELVLGLGQAVVEEVAQGDDAEPRADQVLADPVAAAAAADDAQGDGVVGRRPVDGAGPHESQSGGHRGRRLDELAALLSSKLHGSPPAMGCEPQS
jgi:hypothetical protein